MSGLSYTQLLNELNKEVAQRQPDDVLQFCASFFNRKLEQERNTTRTLSPNPNASPSLGGRGGSIGSSPAATTAQQNVGSGAAAAAAPLARSTGTATAEAAPSSAASAGASTFPGVTNAAANLFTGGGFGGGGFGGSSTRSAAAPPAPAAADAGPDEPSSHISRPAASAGYSFPDTDDASSNFHNIASGQAGTAVPPRQQSPEQIPASYNANRRTSVSAESMLPSEDNTYQRVIVKKSADQLHRIDQAISRNLLFKNLDEEQLKDVMDAMSEKRLTSAGSVIIKQGDVGDFFYVVESGRFDIFVKLPAGADGRVVDDSGRSFGKKVAEAQEGGSFGELALMYNAPRAATVVSKTSNAVLWALDRITFRRILMENTSRRRRMYETFLETVHVLKGLSPSERQKIADSLDTCVFEKGATVIRQGDVGEQFFIIESGEADVQRVGEGTIAKLSRGDYFGESALINDAPRNATIIASSRLKVATLGKRAFVRLLGPVMDILKRDERSLQVDEGVDPTSTA